MSWLQSWDTAVFRWINLSLSNSFLDQVMPFFAWNRFFVPAVVVLAVCLVVKGGVRGRVFVAVALVIIALGDTYVINMLKHTLQRPRPFSGIPDSNLLVGKGSSASMPSSHTSTWFAAAFLAFVYYRKSWRFMYPLAAIIAFSRIYVGAHYPSDVVGGAMFGTGYAAAGVAGLQVLWQRLGRDWFPIWWARMPSLLAPEVRRLDSVEPADLDKHWRRLGYVLIALVFLVRLAYLASGEIELSEDEAYQWTWSKHLALSYYSKPPLIAYTQFLGTPLWGDNEFGVRFFSPVLAAVMSILIFRFMAREANPRTAFFLLLGTCATPLLAVGCTLMTVDPLLVFFWTAAMLVGWRAVQSESSGRLWVWTALFMGLAFLSKYTALAQLACWAVFFFLYRPVRKHLRAPGPYVGLGIFALCTLPVIIWNAQHDWITIGHLSANAQLNKEWQLGIKNFADFVGAEAGLLNPIFFAGAIWAGVDFWRRYRNDPLLIFLFSMGAPLFIGYALYTFRARVLPNWIAPAIVPLFCLAAIYWKRRWQEGAAHWVKPGLAAGFAVGLATVIILHDTDMLKKIAGRPLPVSLDPLRRVRA